VLNIKDIVNLTHCYDAISSDAAIAPSMENMYSVDDPHVIKCVISEILSQVTVTWTTTTVSNDLGKLDFKEGKFAAKIQTSELILSKAQIVALKAANTNDPAHAFTCKFSAGTQLKEYSATQTIKIYTPGKDRVRKL
jgi:hypothetical protein